MNEAEKCPVCRSDGRKERGREDGEYVAYYVCDTCMFMCGLEDLPRIAAAMDLARKHKIFGDYKGYDPNKVADLVYDITLAEHRVCEVFE